MVPASREGRITPGDQKEALAKSNSLLQQLLYSQNPFTPVIKVSARFTCYAPSMHSYAYEVILPCVLCSSSS